MGLDVGMRPQLVRRTILLGIGAGAVALWSAGLRVARAVPPDRSKPAVRLSAPAAGASAVLYEEDPAAPVGKRFAADVHWRIDKKPDSKGGAPETLVHADVEVPERGMALSVVFAHNRDTSLPATHTIELIFKLAAGFAHGEIANVPGILMKEDETARGVPLRSTSVKVTTRYFLIGLSADEKDRAMNMRLLHERAWFDLPIVYGDKRRAILAFAKGHDGEQAFGEAFAAWDDDDGAPGSSRPSSNVNGRPQSK